MNGAELAATDPDKVHDLRHFRLRTDQHGDGVFAAHRVFPDRGNQPGLLPGRRCLELLDQRRQGVFEQLDRREFFGHIHGANGGLKIPFQVTEFGHRNSFGQYRPDFSHIDPGRQGQRIQITFFHDNLSIE
ncbi:hypothetical protein [Pseudomonas sp. ANT_J12]|uniref:hypothetical protein n=1 Tax=Pseudomonas sp. ANT_J12 TaxID=2597351 RepID=UPI0021142794|nr:hypothetical protein [Pseudomonas sp. ANT_J12]